jgi:hypothetical protein
VIDLINEILENLNIFILENNKLLLTELNRSKPHSFNS